MVGAGDLNGAAVALVASIEADFPGAANHSLREFARLHALAATVTAALVDDVLVIVVVGSSSSTRRQSALERVLRADEACGHALLVAGTLVTS